MNAAIVTPPRSLSAAPAEAVNTASREPRSFGSYQAQSILLSALVVFVGSAAIHYATQGVAIEAVGLGLFLSFWIGAGFGFLVGGVRWGLEQFELDH